ncbi:MAG: hypothetical protein J6K03_06955 [Oscillospiraceae bacterium]|nr:hypothetical protein [Oscillospiraceae bacterium]
MEQINVVVSAKVDCTDKQGYAHSGVDPERDVAQKIAQWVGDGIVVDDTQISNMEVLVGFTDRKETQSFLSRLQKNQYGVARCGEKILVCGHCVASVVMAAEYLLSLKPEDVTEDFCQILTYDGWITDVPEFDGEYLGMTDCCFENVEFVYTADRDCYDKYLDTLQGTGYKKTFENAICDNLFSRWTKGDSFLSVSFSQTEQRVRIISGSLDKNNFFDIIPGQTDHEKVTDVTVTQMMLDYLSGSFGMCYIITLEDGSFVIFDGGHVRVINGYPRTFDHARLYSLLQELNKRPDGQIVINAWYMTHEHSDHFNVFYWFCKEFGDKVTIKTYAYCPCSDTVSFNAKNPEYHTTNGRLAQAAQWAGGFDLVTLQTGDDFTLGGVRFEILYTVDDLFPDRLHYFNDSSFVCKMTYGGQSTMWLGDICAAPSEMLCKRYTPEYLKSDIVQMAHHGLNGAHQELYDAIDAKVLFWSLWNTLALKQLADDADTSVEHIRIARNLLLRDNPPECYYHQKVNYHFRLPYNGAEGELINL